MKKVLSMILAGVLLAGVIVGCSGEKTEEPAAPTTTTGGTAGATTG